ncbi:hypothetical protein HXX76_001385 [Chlamydomonas incerta]|uniref:Peptidase A1 domain-containing protein n=1 Tax=Chlamydomonas incerta TaxID=51695 RepID=A0A835WC21_CHLIN|nr:hypothetical protein HXX76_001385 [Chlamydomonas incerta]|eukprot:KAG2444641.1 hypothetical protein HXX76_001385 [Chlamydomonas incerta]
MFQRNASATSSTIGCFDARCSCGGSSCTCKNDQCGYSVRYLEGSSTSGFLTEDLLAVGDGGPAAKLVFGCAQSETGLLRDQSADGIFGMGRSPVSLHGQLVGQGIIDDVFSMCLGAPKEGVLLLGNVALPADAPAPVVTPVVGGTNRYNLQIEGLTFNGQQLVSGQTWFSYGLGTIWDSGTTFSYFTRSVFNLLVGAIRRHVEANPDLVSAPGPYSDDICWSGAPAGDASKLGPYFPGLELLLAGGVRLARAPLHYLYPNGAAWCLAFFDNAYSSTVLGANMLLDTVATYDGRLTQMRFTAYECDRLSVALAVTGHDSSNITIPAADINCNSSAYHAPSGAQAVQALAAACIPTAALKPATVASTSYEEVTAAVNQHARIPGVRWTCIDHIDHAECWDAGKRVIT